MMLNHINEQILSMVKSKGRKFMFKSIITLLLVGWMFAATFATAQNLNESFQTTFYTDLRVYTWEEFDDNGAQNLSETGSLFGFGVVPKIALNDSKNFFLRGDFTMYFASVGYNGFTFDQLGNQTPFTTNTNYFGFEATPELGYNFALSKEFDLTPVTGPGFEHWSRGINGGNAPGYTENYSVFLWDITAEGTYKVDKDIQFIPWFGLRFPLSFSESVDLSQDQGPSDISLSPGTSPRIRFGLDGSFYRAFASLSFETWSIGKSPQDQNYLQPNSSRKIFMIKVGYTM